VLHAALKAVLPATNSTISAAAVNQCGSLVAPDRLRFDFTCPVPLTPAQLSAVERWANEALLRADDAQHAQEAGAVVGSSSGVTTVECSLEEARSMNAVRIECVQALLRRALSLHSRLRV
jgi:alanyl-tRNA synthetase